MAQIWNTEQPGESATHEYDAKENIMNIAWSKEFKDWVMIALDSSIQTLKV